MVLHPSSQVTSCLQIFTTILCIQTRKVVIARKSLPHWETLGVFQKKKKEKKGAAAQEGSGRGSGTDALFNSGGLFLSIPLVYCCSCHTFARLWAAPLISRCGSWQGNVNA